MCPGQLDHELWRGMEKQKHIIETQQFDLPRIERLFEQTRRVQRSLETGNRHEFGYSLKGRSMISLFYEPSTRTRISFERAAQLCGMNVCGTENAGEFSSAAKGETLEDSIRTLTGYYPDVIVLRHKETGAAQRAADTIDRYQLPVHVINGGDGTGQHPTQALLDLYTIWKSRKEKIENVHVVMGGDLAHGRTVHSLAYVLAKYGTVHFTFVAPTELQMKKEITDYLTRHGIRYTLETDPKTVLRDADVVYWTRLQKERLDPKLREDIERHGMYQIGQSEVDMMKPDALILHPLPRVGEISTEIDDDPRAQYFKQAQNGLYVRMALLLELLG